ncbi:MAG: Hsp33 family molecular chaperone HslO [Oscillospiraceae bacterium]|nr:Hsp33 family molecular chaperone HslO [Oscillospiraceae bacterium]
MDKLIKAITADGSIRITAAVTTGVVGDAQKMHHSFPIATAALGRVLTAALIMGSDLKTQAGIYADDDRGPSITMQFKGGGPLGIVMAVADSNGTVKGYTSNPDVVLPSKNGKLDVGGGVGTDGYVSVVKDLRLKEPYTGISPIQTGEIAEDLAYYFAKSEQTPSAVSLGVLVDTDCSVKRAGGFIIQVMPGGDELAVKRLEKSIESLPSITELLSAEASCEDLVRTVMLGFDIKILSESDIQYHCDCSLARVERALISLGKDELERLIEEQDETEVTCSFCDKVYKFGEKELRSFIKK